MWNAFKSDLLDFVTTIQSDLGNAIGEEQDKNEKVTGDLEQKVVDIRRSFETYSEPISEANSKAFEKFKKKFNPGMEATSIANLLDEEPDVSRYYAELVPARISPEEFWSRYFFRLKHVNDEDLSKNEEDEDEEELTWESSEQGSPCDPSPSSSPKTSDLESLEIENKNLKSKMLMLIKRIEDLEADLQNKNGTIEDLQRQLASATCRANRVSENEINNICDASKNMTNEKDNKSNNEPDTNENENDQESVESVSSTGSSCVIVSSADLEDDTKLLESGASSKNSLVDLDDDEEASWS